MIESVAGRTLAVLTSAIVLASGAQSVSAQRSAEKASGRTAVPTGAEIAAAARAGALDQANAVTATILGKPFKFTPAQGKQGTSPENGIFLGVLENGAAGDETGLPAGRYNLYGAKVNGQWKSYAESNGQVVREGLRTSVGPASPGAKASFTEKGWCITVMALSPVILFMTMCF